MNLTKKIETKPIQTLPDMPKNVENSTSKTQCAIEIKIVAH